MVFTAGLAGQQLLQPLHRDVRPQQAALATQRAPMASNVPMYPGNLGCAGAPGKRRALEVQRQRQRVGEHMLRDFLWGLQGVTRHLVGQEGVHCLGSCDHGVRNDWLLGADGGFLLLSVALPRALFTMQGCHQSGAQADSTAAGTEQQPGFRLPCCTHGAGVHPQHSLSLQCSSARRPSSSLPVSCSCLCACCRQAGPPLSAAASCLSACCCTLGSCRWARLPAEPAASATPR